MTETSRRTWTRTTRTAAAALVLVGALAGCGPANAGSAAADAAGHWFDDVPGVTSVDASGTNDLPWNGTLRATVHLDAAAPHAQVLAAARRAEAFERDRVSDAFTLEQQVGGTLTQVPAADVDAPLLDYRDALAAGTGAARVALRTEAATGDGGRALVVALGAAGDPRPDVTAVLPLVRAAATVPPPAGSTVRSLDAGPDGEHADAVLSVAGDATDRLDVLAAVLTSGVTAESATVDRSGVVVTVPAGDVHAAEQAVRALGRGADVRVVPGTRPATAPAAPGTAGPTGPAPAPSGG